MAELAGAVLIGGLSRRMGTDKGGLQFEGRSLPARAVALLSSRIRDVVLLGSCISERLSIEVGAGVRALADVAGVSGPLAGVLAALRSRTDCDWLIVGCDMPAFDERAVGWLIAQHRTDREGTFALLPGREQPEPLLGIYTPSCHSKLEAAAARGEFALHRAIATLDATIAPAPAELARQWLNVNTPAEWEAFLRHAASSSEPARSAPLPRQPNPERT